MADCNGEFNLCPKFSKTFSILGRKWNGLIIEVLLCEGPQRFKDIASKVKKCGDRVLVERLRELENEGLIKHTATDSAHSVYELTDRGSDLKDVRDAIHTWADKWYSLADCHQD